MSTVSNREVPPDEGSVSTQSKEFQVSEFEKVSTSLNGVIRVSAGDGPSLTISASERALAALDVKVRDGTLELGPNKDGSGYSESARSLASHLLDLILKRRTSENRSIAYTSHYLIEISSPRLRELMFGGKARLDIESQLLDTEGVKLVCGGVSAVSSKSISAPNVELVSSGTASLKVKDIKSDSVDCRISGTATIRVNGETEAVSARISGTGSLDATKLLASRASIVTSGASNASVHAQKELEVTSSGACAVRYLGNPQKNTTFSGVLDCSPLNSEG
ncbi:MAG: DUF2807 domain-containing protein [Gammaproteobacteria bacterium]|nr:DUF2807 domain-containing protein [Gammaproteobacteria bacterium]